MGFAAMILTHKGGILLFNTKLFDRNKRDTLFLLGNLAIAQLKIEKEKYPCYLKKSYALINYFDQNNVSKSTIVGSDLVGPDNLDEFPVLATLTGKPLFWDTIAQAQSFLDALDHCVAVESFDSETAEQAFGKTCSSSSLILIMEDGGEITDIKDNCIFVKDRFGDEFLWEDPYEPS